MIKEKFVLCIPNRCGLNDILCQIWQSMEYCKTFHRSLLIDTRISGLGDDFSNYLIPVDKQIRVNGQVSNVQIEKLNNLTCHPRQNEGKLDFLYVDFHVSYRIAGYKYSIFRKLMYLICSMTLDAGFSKFNLIRKFSFIFDSVKIRNKRVIPLIRNDCPQDLIVHHQSGGGLISIGTLRCFKFTPELRNMIKKSISYCGNGYFAVHVRNTDYRTDYEGFFNRIKDSVSNKRILVCSDDRHVIEFAKNFFTESDVFTVSETENHGGKPVHKSGWNKDITAKKRLNHNMFIDLVCLANADRLYISQLETGNFSGYSLLAKQLHENKNVLTSLLND